MATSEVGRASCCRLVAVVEAIEESPFEPEQIADYIAEHHPHDVEAVYRTLRELVRWLTPHMPPDVDHVFLPDAELPQRRAVHHRFILATDAADLRIVECDCSTGQDHY